MLWIEHVIDDEDGLARIGTTASWFSDETSKRVVGRMVSYRTNGDPDLDLLRLDGVTSGAEGIFHSDKTMSIIGRNRFFFVDELSSDAAGVEAAMLAHFVRFVSSGLWVATYMFEEDAYSAGRCVAITDDATASIFLIRDDPSINVDDLCALPPKLLGGYSGDVTSRT